MSQRLPTYGRPFGSLYPQKTTDILGNEVAGTIVKLGRSIVNHTLGKRIAAALTIHPIGQVDVTKLSGSPMTVNSSTKYSRGLTDLLKDHG